jgi:GNAT superfamily N-acetyltransferase
MGIDITVRPARRDEAQRLADWAGAMAWETERKRLDPGTVLRGVQRVFEEPGRGRYLIAERDGAAAGTLMLTYEWSDWRCADWWWIQSVYVAPGHRRQGVYATLYRHVRDEAAARGDVCGLRLYVEKENAVAQRTYGQLGMRDAGYFMYEEAMAWVKAVVASDPRSE